jgi:hypothetical protein
MKKKGWLGCGAVGNLLCTVHHDFSLGAKHLHVARAALVVSLRQVAVL